MVKIITYGTFDMFHFGHVNLLKRAKELGDYLIVGVTSENFDLNRGKLNVNQPLMERMMQVKESGFADEVIVEEYEGQKIDDIIKYKIDYFAVGSDWKGKFDYLNSYCRVVYIERTKGISSTKLRISQNYIEMGIIGYTPVVDKFMDESRYVSGLYLKGIYADKNAVPGSAGEYVEFVTDNMDVLLQQVDAVYLFAPPNDHYEIIHKAIGLGKHVLCENPVTLRRDQTAELFLRAREKQVVLYEAVKTAHFLAFNRLSTLVKSGVIGEIKAVDVTCTSLEINNYWTLDHRPDGGSLASWGSYALFAIFRLLGFAYKKLRFTILENDENGVDLFTKLDLIYPNAAASAKLGLGVKSEGELVVSGTNGYLYVPSPWWKTDYFEIRYENFTKNRRYFYPLEGEGLRYEQADFLKEICRGKSNTGIYEQMSIEISEVMEHFVSRTGEIDYIY